MPSSVAVNGTDLASLGCYVWPTGRWNIPRRWTTAEIAGRFPMAVAPVTMTPAVLTFEGVVQPTPVTGAGHRTAQEALADLLHQGLLRITVDDGLGTVRETEGYTTDWAVTPPDDSLTAPSSRVRWQVAPALGAWRSPALQSVVLAAGVPRALAVGTVGSPWRCWIYGATSNPFTLTFRRVSGEVVTTMSFAEALTSAQYYVVDGGAMTVQKVASGGAPTNALTNLTGVFPPRGIAPEDAWRGGGVYGTVELSSGTGLLEYPLLWGSV